MKSYTYGSIIAGLAIASVSPVAAQTKNVHKPNIILILMDDMGYGDLSCYGATQYKTPNIDRLAAEGMRFTNFCVSQAVCSASRAGLLTGCYSNRVGIKGALFPNSEIGLNPEEEIIPELLKKSNYKSAIIGKWHLGDSFEFLPLQQGFDEYYGLPYSNDMWPVDYDGSAMTKKDSLKNKYNMPPLTLIEGNTKTTTIFRSLEDQSNLTTLYTERATKFIAENKMNPFCLYIAHNMPHVPLAVSQKFKGKSEQGLYGDVMMEIDWSVGEVLNSLKKNGLEKNTIVIFTSDNGPSLSFGNHAGSSGGLREGKMTTCEGGHRVPCIMKWPGHIPPGSVCNKLSSTIDILPTLAHLTNSPLPEKKIDGVNILPLLLGDDKANPRESFAYYWNDGLEAITDGKWKFVFAHTGASFVNCKPGVDGFPGTRNSQYSYEESLYDLRRDPGERYNVKEYYPEVVAELKNLADQYRKDIGDELQNVKGISNREPGHRKIEK
jgi:arylsulfatase A-like enzyme